MSKKTVYFFVQWNGNENQRSLRRGTEAAIESAGGKPGDILKDTALEVDESEIDGNGFYPKN